MPDDDDPPELPKGTHTRRVRVTFVLDEDRPPHGKPWDEPDLEKWLRDSINKTAWRWDIVSYEMEFPDGLYDDPQQPPQDD